MILEFKAEEVGIEETEFGVLVVGFYTEENYLTIQQSLEESDEQDIGSGMNSYYIERDDQSYGGYGGVESIHLSHNQIEVKPDETGKENLDCDALKVEFEIDDETYKTLAEKLKFIFGDAVNVK
jgi:hypothetical protein